MKKKNASWKGKTLLLLLTLLSLAVVISACGKKGGEANGPSTDSTMVASEENASSGNQKASTSEEAPQIVPLDPAVAEAIQKGLAEHAQILPGTVRIYSSGKEMADAIMRYSKEQGDIGLVKRIQFGVKRTSDPNEPFHSELEEPFVLLELDGERNVTASNAATEPRPVRVHYINLAPHAKEEDLATWKEWENKKVVFLAPSPQDLYWRDEGFFPFHAPNVYNKALRPYAISDFRALEAIKGLDAPIAHTWSFADFCGDYAYYSGAGAWGILFHLEKDGRFSLSYQDVDRDEILQSELTGQLSNFAVTDDGYTFTIASLQSSVAQGEEKVTEKDGRKLKTVYEDFGMKVGGTGTIYPSNTPRELFREEVVNLMDFARVSSEVLGITLKPTITLSPELTVWWAQENQ